MEEPSGIHHSQQSWAPAPDIPIKHLALTLVASSGAWNNVIHLPWTDGDQGRAGAPAATQPQSRPHPHRDVFQSRGTTALSGTAFISAARATTLVPAERNPCSSHCPSHPSPITGQLRIPRWQAEKGSPRTGSDGAVWGTAAGR